MREDYAKQAEIIEDRLTLFRKGHMSVMEQTVERPQWTDVTEQAIRDDERTLEMLRSVLKVIDARETRDTTS